MTRVLLFALAFALLGASAAPAEEAIPTASNVSKTPDASASPTPPPLQPAMADIQDEDGPRMGPCGPASDKDGKADRGPHGQVEVGVGTNGYRHVGGVVCKPIGDNGAVVISVEHTEWNGRRRLVGEQGVSAAEQVQPTAP